MADRIRIVSNIIDRNTQEVLIEDHVHSFEVLDVRALQKSRRALSHIIAIGQVALIATIENGKAPLPLVKKLDGKDWYVTSQPEYLILK